MTAVSMLSSKAKYWEWLNIKRENTLATVVEHKNITW